MYGILTILIEWNNIDTDLKIILIISSILIITFFWLIIYSAVKAAMENALEKALDDRARRQSNYELALQIKTLEKQISDLQSRTPKELDK